MLKTTLLAIAVALAVQPSTANACHNAVEWTTNDYVRVVARAEKQLEAGDFSSAKRTLGRMKFPTTALAERAENVKAVLKLRMAAPAKELEAVAVRLKAQSDAKAKDVRYKAWLAEALIATGKKDEGRAILAELQAGDLMPDAYAIVALAKLSSGTERYELWKACRTRAKNKEMCELPAEIKVTTKAAQATR